jgi:hypothetical protein
MAFYVVKSGGTATGDLGREATQPTGSFASRGSGNYYDNILAAQGATTAPTADDIILVSDAHSHAYTTAAAYIGSTSTTNPIVHLSVSDSNMDQESFGAEETTGAGFDLTWTGEWAAKSMTYIIQDEFKTTTTSSSAHLTDCLVRFTGSTDGFVLNTPDGVTLNLRNTDILYDAGTSGTLGYVFALDSTARLNMLGGSVLATTGGIDTLVGGNNSNGGCALYFKGVDLTDVDTYLVAGLGGVTADDYLDVRIEGCKLHASVVMVEETFTSPDQVVEIYNCSSTSAGAEYQFYRRYMAGDVEVEDDSGIHRGESTAFPGETKVSMKITTSTRCTRTAPLLFELPARYADLSTNAKVKVYFASTTTLTDGDLWIDLHAPDGTNANMYNYYTTENTDILSAGTEHTDDSAGSTWLNGVSDLVGYNEYSLELDTTATPASDGVPKLVIGCGLASTTIYMDVIYDTVAAE